MDSLFDQLKAEPPVNNRAPSPVFKSKPPNELVSADTADMDGKAVRRESMPPPSTSTVMKSSQNKSRSLSPPKITIKSLKVKVERTKLTDLPVLKQVDNACKPGAVLPETNGSSKSTNANTLTAKDRAKAPKLVTPTKAQQKLFDPDVLVKAQQLTKLKVKRCLVRLPRQDLVKLQKKMRVKNKNEKEAKKIGQKATGGSSTAPPDKGKKRKSNSGSGSSSPVDTSPTTKRKRNPDANEAKQGTGFFIKLNALTKRPGKVVKKLKEKKKYNTAADKAANAIATTATKPTKFTRTQLIKLYGKRFFRAHVKMERCAHPMMLIFESNARARRMQSKRNKSKNLSVSFREQVEIFGDSSDSESEPSSQVEEQAPCTSLTPGEEVKSLPSAQLTVTPARLKKVENGKVVDDIELDTSLFIMPTAVTASTPYASPGRKRREKKSFSPLKGDGTPSPRKEQLKLANEKMPPSGLRRLPADEVDDEDDEDDECEYIVPIEIPARRSSRTNSCNAAEEVTGKSTYESGAEETVNTSTECSASTTQNSSGESFASAVEEPATSDKEMSKDDSLVANASDEVAETVDNDTAHTNGENDIDKNTSQNEENLAADKNVAEELRRIGTISPAQSLNSLTDLVDSLMNNVSDGQTTTGAEAETSGDFVTPKTNDDNTKKRIKMVPELLNEHGNKIKDALDGDISLQLFVEDDPDNLTGNSNFLTDNVRQDSEIVDGIVKERIGELSVQKQLSKAALATDVMAE